ncbi:hypothetical protein OG21DRAFT_1490222 [Imleria badia]|nr:hypothetical protein OG21DRAFT_1490222 [Imleria badia]
MENQTQDLKSQLSQERGTVRHVTLQRDIDVKELQSCLDKMVRHRAPNSSPKHASPSSEPKLERYLSKNGWKNLAARQCREARRVRKEDDQYKRDAPDPDLPREQQLEQEVADLRAQLKVALSNLAAARSHMQQFQDINQANGAALAALKTTHDEYTAGAEAQLSRHELEYKSLEEKLRSKTSETELRAWVNDKKTLEGTIVDMSTSERHPESDRATHEPEATEDRYSREVIAHAQSFKTIENLKHQLGSCQAARIHEVADSTAESTNGDADVGGDVGKKLSSVVVYLRKEKGIVDLQLELCKQENMHLKSQLDHLSQSLQEVRKTLSEERERAVQAATSEAQHDEMLERINQLDILRESNVPPRADCETYSKRSRELDAKLKVPAELELHARHAQITLLETDCKRWQERNTQLLSKHDRIHPADLQTLTAQLPRSDSPHGSTDFSTAFDVWQADLGNAAI